MDGSIQKSNKRQSKPIDSIILLSTCSESTLFCFALQTHGDP